MSRSAVAGPGGDKDVTSKPHLDGDGLRAPLARDRRRSPVSPVVPLGHRDDLRPHARPGGPRTPRTFSRDSGRGSAGLATGGGGVGPAIALIAGGARDARGAAGVPIW